MRTFIFAIVISTFATSAAAQGIPSLQRNVITGGTYQRTPSYVKPYVQPYQPYVPKPVYRPLTPIQPHGYTAPPMRSLGNLKEGEIEDMGLTRRQLIYPRGLND